MMRRTARIFLFFILLAMATTSCTHKDLCLNHPHEVKLRVEFNWQNAPDANPLGMCVFFYPVEEGTYKRIDFGGIRGGYINLDVGKYHVISYNNDTEVSQFYNTNDFNTHGAYTREGSVLEPAVGNSASTAPKADGAQEERVVITPDMIWGCTAFDVEVTETGVSYSCVPFISKGDAVNVETQEHVITLYPDELLCHYSYEIRNVQNLGSASQMCASLSGMSGRVTLSTLELHKECVTLPLGAKINVDESTVTGEFYTFGHHPENEEPHKMLLYVWMNDGRKLYFGSDDENFDVTGQVHNAPNPKRVHIIIDGLDLPKQMEEDGGYDPSVDDWDTINRDIQM